MIKKKFLNACKINEECKKENKKFLHQKFYKSLIFVKKKLFDNFWLMQRRKQAFFAQIAFISRIFLENNTENKFLCKLELPK